jgi:serine protease inhibitor
MSQKAVHRPVLILLVVTLLLLAFLWFSFFHSGPGELAGGSFSAAAAAPSYPASIPFDDYDAQRAVREDNPVSDSFLSSIQAFSLRATPAALSAGGENPLYSPLSLWYALALCADTAGGQTRAQLLTVLGQEEGADLAPQAAALFRLLFTDNEMGRLLLANSLWLNREFSFHQERLDRAAQYYYAASFESDFSDPDTAEQMGQWLSQATGNQLEPAVSAPRPEDLMTLFSTLSFSDQWIDQFDAGKTTSGPFTNADGSQGQADYLHATYPSHGYWYGENFVASSLGLKNGGSLTFLLPDEGGSPRDLLSDPELLSDLFTGGGQGRGHGQVIFQIPKFRLESELDLTAPLQAMGISDAFQPELADFSPLSPDALCLTAVRQHSVFSLDEQGVSASSFTRLDYAGAAPPDGRAELILDRPFLYVLCAPQGLPLFIGIVEAL